MIGDQKQQADLKKQADPEATRDRRPTDPLPEEINHSFERLEQLLSQIHATLDTNAREGAHREFSSWRPAAYFIQIIVLSLIVLALLDWILQGPGVGLFVKLAFAGVLQLCVVTAFLLTQKKS